MNASQQIKSRSVSKLFGSQSVIIVAKNWCISNDQRIFEYNGYLESASTLFALEHKSFFRNFCDYVKKTIVKLRESFLKELLNRNEIEYQKTIE